MARNSRNEIRKTPTTTKSRLPEPKVIRIMERHAIGESDRKIARAENVDRKTVARVTEREMGDSVREARERFYGLISQSLDTLEHGLRENKDARLAYAILSATGVVPSVAEKESILAQPPQSLSETALQQLVAQLTPFEKTMFAMCRMMVTKSKLLNMTLPKLPIEELVKGTGYEAEYQAAVKAHQQEGAKNSPKA